MGLFGSSRKHTKSWYKKEIDRKMREIAQVKVYKATAKFTTDKALRQRRIDELRADIVMLKMEMKDAPND